MTTAITGALIRLARRIGRWILEHLAERGIVMLRGYMGGKIGDFRRRLAKTKTNRRRLWLAGRINRWSRALRWLEAHTGDLVSCAGTEFTELARAQERKGVPIVAECERLVAS